ncbi:ScbR family autoregulator-binding transcription factor [Amycolatopsis sp. NBC_01480]|jgi:AcrR family transcriptional regulator|uniref:ScbR family autoregulator-binding transcription factor n=1 Tax=Amycolatopsis sp. NBC_01480 TaxID=2903562 RepID=UPI002E2B916F|nr:ScbR family autoregulator-binding transcription factor [Amycolatopsis sp. NBC_01480]
MGTTVTKQARAEQTRLLLLDAAAVLLHRDGYAATSMVDIAREAGITKGGLYFHFSSKDEICDEVQQAAVTVLNEHVEHREQASLPALRRLAVLGHALMGWLETEPKVGASFRLTREMGSKDERYVAFSRAWFARVRQYVADAHEAGELAGEAPSDTVALLLVVTCVGLEAVVASGTIDPDVDLARTLIELWRLIDPASPGWLSAVAPGIRG